MDDRACRRPRRNGPHQSSPYRCVQELAERYEAPLPQTVSRVAELEQAVNRHLEGMGFYL